jgi:hypothetical protein
VKRPSSQCCSKIAHRVEKLRPRNSKRQSEANFSKADRIAYDSKKLVLGVSRLKIALFILSRSSQKKLGLQERR